jgi:hypothetical protein
MKFNQHTLNTAIVLLFLFVGPRGFSQTPELCVGHHFTEPEAIEFLAECKATYSNKKEWEARKKLIIEGILNGSELSDLLNKYRDRPFNAFVHWNLIQMDGYYRELIQTRYDYRQSSCYSMPSWPCVPSWKLWQVPSGLSEAVCCTGKNGIRCFRLRYGGLRRNPWSALPPGQKYIAGSTLQ